ncbi:uncharacterized protein N7511_001985 [Penicillium nucicola]|uniref:uncharacterized protein n=1 Tax=Penicillium nucicola TaxID=1850975 RepID=UPI00254576D1|nr:uncharacterized protein N7511_001985 [Penicillium nucicola]KAJ5769934.1 hypothetical protein N7511_001985 [Penicillium nucicola]
MSQIYCSNETPLLGGPYKPQKSKSKKETLPRGIEPRSPALIGINDKRKSSPLDQGRLNDRVTARPLGWLIKT